MERKWDQIERTLAKLDKLGLLKKMKLDYDVDDLSMVFKNDMIETLSNVEKNF